MSSSTCAGNPDPSSTGFGPTPPPPPPPPPGSGQVPISRINTAESPTTRRPQNSIDSLEPPAAIQNAMMTKDKKPFTYTPGMGGKLDLSQIRSPRMARRVAKNANDEGIEGPPKSSLEQKMTTTAPTTAANLFVQPQVAVPVFPTNVPSQPSLNRVSNSRDGNRVPTTCTTTVPDRQTEPPRTSVKVETKVTPITIVSSQPSSPQTPDTPPQVTLSKAPTPWLQNKNKPSEELPEWAKRTNAPRQQNSSSPETPVSPPVYQQVQQSPPIRQVQQPLLVQQAQQPTRQQTRPQTQQQQQDRVVPVRIEDRPSVFSVKHETGHHQLKQPSNYHQQRWGQNPPQSQVQPQTQNQPQQTSGPRVIPIMVEDGAVRSPVGQSGVPSYSQPQTRNIPIENQASRVNVQRNNPVPIQQQEPGPLQSRAFRVLQKITDTDADNDVDLGAEQIRKLQLTEDDKVLMNKFKEQVDGDTYLHQEEDPRYRGAAIPSRAFRFLQNMTDAEDASTTSTAPRASANVISKKINRNMKSLDEAQANLPPSEQQVQEPKKYMGSAIPSRSFRILQAMTAPESVATQENRQPDFISQTENSMPGNQQGVFFPGCPSPFWNPDGGWWGYYPMQYAPNTNSHNVPYDPYAYYSYGDGNAYAYYPIYDQTYAQAYGQSNSSDRTRHDYSESNYARIYPQCVLSSQALTCDQNYNRYYEQNGHEACYNSVYPSKEDSKKETMEQGTKHNPNLLTVPKWNVSRSSSNSSKDSDDTTAMNITDEEESVPEVTIIAMKGRNQENLEEQKLDVSELVTAESNDVEEDDTSDSESSDADSDVESTSESSKTSSSSSSDNDSESEYLAYSTGLNPREIIPEETDNLKLNLDKDSRQSLSGTTISEDTYEQSSRLSSDKLSFSDCDSDADDEYQIESLNNDSVLPHQLSVIYEDVEQLDHLDNQGLEDSRNARREKKNVILDEIEDPLDDVDSATVSVSLPLRFKFSVSENNEEVTTVIVGDSLIKAEKGGSKEDEIYKCRGTNDENNDVHVDFKIGRSDETSVDFTLKKQSRSKGTTNAELTLRNEEKCVKSRKDSEENVDIGSLDVDEDSCAQNADCEFTFRGDKGAIKNVDCDQNVETEFTVRTRKTDVTTHTWKKDLDLELESDVEDRISNRALKNATKTECTMKSTMTNGIKENHDEELTIVNSKIELDGDVCKEVTESRSLKIEEKESVETEFSVKRIDTVERSNEKEDLGTDISNEPQSSVPEDADDETIKGSDISNTLSFDKIRNDLNNRSKHLLSVQNSRDETDDEDSGVTSDMSRLISEVDTDSECTLSSKKMSKYQRTQTHSRLFKLLNDDSILTEDSSEDPVSPIRRECLSLPLKNVFSYDETYYSNYSSGLTSPEYSPVCEQSWRRLHESENGGTATTTTTSSNESPGFNGQLGLRTMANQEGSSQEDPYYQTWKIPKPPSEFDYDILPSLTFKKLENRVPYKAHRIHVLCPRIKSSKNVPHALQSATGKSIALSTLPSLSHAKNDHC